MFEPFKIRNVEINPPLILSPMAGVTDVSFRRLLKRRGGIGLTVSEFISVEGLTRHNPKSKRQMRFFEDERPFRSECLFSSPVKAARRHRSDRLGVYLRRRTDAPQSEIQTADAFLRGRATV